MGRHRIRPWMISCLLVIVGLTCMTWDGIYYVIYKARIISEAASFRWYLVAQLFFFCAFLVVLIPKLLQIRLK